MKNFGSLDLALEKGKKKFALTVEPHVSLVLKRIFNKIHTYQFGTLHLSVTPENAFDLKWFIQRYPLQVTEQATNVMEEYAIKWSERESIVDRILHTAISEKKFIMKLPPREYQTLAAEMWLAVNGLLLADDVGLGKTCSAIAALTDPRTRPALVVTLTHLPPQWKDEIQKFTDLDVHLLKKSTPYDLTKYHEGRVPDVVVSNYHKLSGWAETLSPIIKSVVWDEVQELRHYGTNKYRAAMTIARTATFRLGLSATPIYNYGGEIFNVLNACQPDALGDVAEFKREWCTYDELKMKIKDPEAFGTYARNAGLMLRRTRKEVKRELPPVITVPHFVDANPEVLLAMEGDAIALAKIILSQNEAFKGQKMNAAGEFNMRMRQATGISKAPFVAEFVRFLVEETDEPVVLYGWHREVYSIWEEKLKDLNPVMYTGSESVNQKEINKKKFINGESKVFIISLRAGAGLDGLQHVCRNIVNGELDWSPGVHEQGTGRVARDGQKDTVTVYYMISQTGSDPVISDMLGIKRQQCDGIRDPEKSLVAAEEVDPDHIKHLAERFLADRNIAVPFSTGV